MRSRRTHALSLTRGAAIGASAGFASPEKSLDANKELKRRFIRIKSLFMPQPERAGRDRGKETNRMRASALKQVSRRT
jgi:cytochrome c1